jgi:glycosyltransferase involved in cell wall biosynthesis
MARLLEVLIKVPNAQVTYASINTKKHYKNIDNFPRELFSQIDLKVFDSDTSPRVTSALSNLFLTAKPYHATRFFIPEMQHWLQEFELKHFDVAIIEGAFMGYFLPLVKRISQKTVLRAHNLEHQIWSRMAHVEANFIKSWYLKTQSNRLDRFETQLAQLSDEVWTLSPIDSLWFADLNPNTNYVPVTVNEAEGITEVKAKTCFFLGALDWPPNLAGLQWFVKEVWPKVIELEPDAKFHFGGNNAPAYLASGLAPSITFHGKVPSAEAFSKSHGVSVIPLLAGSGIRIKILETARWGIPMVSTSIGCEGIFDEKSDAISIADNPEILALKLVELMNAPEVAFDMGKKAKEEISERYSVSSALEIVSSLCKN